MSHLVLSTLECLFTIAYLYYDILYNRNQHMFQRFCHSTTKMPLLIETAINVQRNWSFECLIMDNTFYVVEMQNIEKQKQLNLIKILSQLMVLQSENQTFILICFYFNESIFELNIKFFQKTIVLFHSGPFTSRVEIKFCLDLKDNTKSARQTQK